MATYAIGDIQGCFDEFLALLKLIKFSNEDTLWLCGDLVNRGPKSLETLRFIHDLKHQAIIVLGNHDLHLLAVHHKQAKTKRGDTLDAILQAPDRNKLMSWLQTKPLIHHDPALGYTMVHAGIHPQWSLDAACSYAQECSLVLQSPQAIQYFAHMYGNKPAIWSNSLTGMERLRVITNYFTRMRFCKPNGELEFSSKGGLETQPKGFLPWYDQRMHNYPDDKVLFGHWAALEGKTDLSNTIALDTGCVWGGKLRAFRLEDKQIFEIPSLQKPL